MYHTSSKIATHDEPWKSFFQFAVAEVARELHEFGDDEDPWEVGVEEFDRFSLGQKLWLLEHVAGALLDPTVPAPNLTSPIEATVYSLFRAVYLQMEWEVDAQDEEYPHEAQAVTLRVLRHELEPDLQKEVPDVGSPDGKQWEFCLECLTDRVLWDRDFMDEELYVDGPRELSELRHHQMRVDDEYFLFTPPDPRESEWLGLYRRFEVLTGRPILPKTSL